MDNRSVSVKLFSLWLALSWIGIQPSNAQEEILPRPAYHAPKASEAMALDLVATESGWIAVGERGHVLLSENGEQWTQAEFVPVQSTLTKVSAAGGHLWAVGHDATIIHSHDGGQTWDLQWFSPELEQPFLDVFFHDRLNGLAIGAYGIYLTTDDGGQTWQERNMAELVISEAIDWDAIERQMMADDPDGMGFDRGCYEFMECHLNAFLKLDENRYMIAAERGYGFRTFDGGNNWEAFRFSYAGSMFGLVPTADGILAFGLRGQVQYSPDFGDTWQLLDSPTQSTLLDGVVQGDGTVLMVGAGAARLRYDPRTESFELTEDRLGDAFAAVALTQSGEAIYAGEAGLSHE